MLCSCQDTDLGPGHHRRPLLILAVPLTCSLMLTGSPSCPACSRAHACRPLLPACSPLRSAPRLASAARPPPSQALTSPDRWWVPRVSSSNRRTGPARLPGPTRGQSMDRIMSSSVSAWQGVVSLGGGRPAVHLPGHRSQEFILPLGHECSALLAVSAQLCSFWRPQETVHFLAFSNSRKLPTVLGLGLLASSIGTLTSASVTCPLSASHMDPCDDTGPAWIIQDPLPS